MFIVYSNSEMLPILKEIEYDNEVLCREFQESISIRNIGLDKDYYSSLFEEIDEEYIKENTEE